MLSLFLLQCKKIPQFLDRVPIKVLKLLKYPFFRGFLSGR
ncbi:hypothetical protein H206_05427 [Candidatus Electrothrix aarhusensis]|uniref:Uncharacterized protein n=1 Tax=Candidatus Electrothrix aarhusensis TaxID=1859131 RepID=A0A3S3QUD7_9BACT|nr:hypothetical protein H206_05427 [Candidatus Electrothrix aarhusensis]